MIEKLLLELDNVLRKSNSSNRPSPAAKITGDEMLSSAEKEQSIALMRVNHSGEVCAQALYRGQALAAKSTEQYKALIEAAREEQDHLKWCEQRLQELNGRKSLLTPLWSFGSFCIGAAAGLAGDKHSLGFLAETENQVSKHLTKHLTILPVNDQRSRLIIEQMRSEELQHATNAEQAGASKLPWTVKLAMKLTAKIMTYTAAKV